MGKVDMTEAPKGFCAVRKPASCSATPNPCMVCDWRKSCCDKETDFTKSNHRCMSFPVFNESLGKEICRKDGQSVIFKKVD